MAGSSATASQMQLSAEQLAFLDERAQEQLRAARVCFGANRFEAAASRAYYCIYSAMWRYMAYTPAPQKGQEAMWHHPTLITAFVGKFSHDKGLTREQKKALKKSINMVRGARIKGDYRFEIVEDWEARRAVTLATKYLEEILGIKM